MSNKKLIIGIGENSYSVICYQVTNRAELLACQIFDKKDFTTKTFKQFLEKNDLHEIETKVILGSQLYRILMIERPNLKDEELSQAAKWLAKDLISDDLENVVVDAFPAVERMSKTNKLYIIIANKKLLQNFYEMSFLTGICLTEITIAEFGLLELTSSENQACMIVYSLAENYIRVLIIYNKEIDFIRNIKINTLLTQEDSLRCNEVASELNRSIDFYATQFGESIKEVLYIPSPFFSENFITLLKSQLTVNLNLLYDHDFSKFLSDNRWNDHIMSFGLITEKDERDNNAAEN